MKKNDNSFLPWVLLTVPVLWLAAILAYGYEEGMTVFDLMGRFTVLVERPFSVRWTPYTLRFMLAALVAYAFAIMLYQSSKAQASSAFLRDYAQTNCREYYAEYFAYWLSNHGDAKKAEQMQQLTPKTYEYFTELAEHNWALPAK